MDESALIPPSTGNSLLPLPLQMRFFRLVPFCTSCWARTPFLDTIPPFIIFLLLTYPQMGRTKVGRDVKVLILGECFCIFDVFALHYINFCFYLFSDVSIQLWIFFVHSTATRFAGHPFSWTFDLLNVLFLFFLFLLLWQRFLLNCVFFGFALLCFNRILSQ